jgi:hypothetical protein
LGQLEAYAGSGAYTSQVAVLYVNVISRPQKLLNRTKLLYKEQKRKVDFLKIF